MQAVEEFKTVVILAIFYNFEMSPYSDAALYPFTKLFEFKMCSQDLLKLKIVLYEITFWVREIKKQQYIG